MEHIPPFSPSGPYDGSANPPLTLQQEGIVLGRGDRAPEPSTPEEWAVHAAVSMEAMAEVFQVKHGENKGVGYRPINPGLPGVNVLYFDSSPDDYEIRVQPPVPMPEIPEGATLEQLQALLSPEGSQARYNATPEYCWTSRQAHQIIVQQHGRNRSIVEMNTEEAAVHSQYLRGVAIYLAGDAQDVDVLSRLVPPEAHE